MCLQLRAQIRKLVPTRRELGGEFFSENDDWQRKYDGLSEPNVSDCLCWRFRCWFGKRAGVYTDYIYQGPMILVLVVRVFNFFFGIRPSAAAEAVGPEPVLHVVLWQLVFIMSLKSPAGVKCWKPQHILHVSDDECEAVVGYNLLETCGGRNFLVPRWKTRMKSRDVFGLVGSYL